MKEDQFRVRRTMATMLQQVRLELLHGRRVSAKLFGSAAGLRGQLDIGQEESYTDIDHHRHRFGGNELPIATMGPWDRGWQDTGVIKSEQARF